MPNHLTRKQTESCFLFIQKETITLSWKYLCDVSTYVYCTCSRCTFNNRDATQKKSKNIRRFLVYLRNDAKNIKKFIIIISFFAYFGSGARKIWQKYTKYHKKERKSACCLSVFRGIQVEKCGISRSLSYVIISTGSKK